MPCVDVVYCWVNVDAVTPIGFVCITSLSNLRRQFRPIKEIQLVNVEIGACDLYVERSSLPF